MKYFFKVDIREPYMGNTIVIGVTVEVNLREPVMLKTLVYTMQDTIAQELRAITSDEFYKLFNH